MKNFFQISILSFLCLREHLQNKSILQSYYAKWPYVNVRISEPVRLHLPLADRSMLTLYTLQVAGCKHRILGLELTPS